LRQRFRTERGAFRREAFRFARPDDTDPRVEAVLDGRRGGSLVSGFFLTYADDRNGPDLTRLAQDRNARPERWYPAERYDDWHLAAFPEHGIAALVVNDDDDGRDGDGERASTRVPFVLLCRPGSLTALLDGSRFRRNPTPVTDVETRLRQSPPVLEIGRVDVSVSLKHVQMRNVRDLESDLEEEIEDALSRSRRRRDDEAELVFRRGGEGTYNVNLQAEFNSPRRTTTVTASASIEGETGYGRVSAYGSGSDKINERGLADKENPVWRNGRNFERAFDEAVRDAERNVLDKIRRLRPPAPNDARRAAWIALINQLR
jgi:hypothetical protein